MRIRKVPIKRDPFARATLMRISHPDRRPCRWCAQPGRFDYYWEPDTRYTYRDEHRRYCSIECWRAYNV